VSNAVLRRLLHAASASVLLIPLIGSWNVLRISLASLAVLAVTLDVWRIRSKTVGKLIESLVPVFKPSEVRRLSGATWLSVGYALAAWFPAVAAVGGIAVAALADPAAWWVGSWGRSSHEKTVSGSAAALAVAVAVLWMLGVAWPTVLCGAVASTVLERWPGPLDDNLLIAPGLACVIWLTA
jgi:dolichol kinase